MDTARMFLFVGGKCRGGTAWAKHYGFYEAAILWLAKQPERNIIPLVLHVHPDTVVDKDGDVRYPYGQKAIILGTFEKGKLLPRH